MSKKKSDGDAPLTDLSALDFGPAWARDKGSKGSQSGNSTGGKKPRHSEGKSQSHSDKGGSRGRKNQRRHHEGQHGGRKDNRRDSRGRGQRAAPIPAPEGVTARIMPIEDGMDAMAKEISATGRTHSVFDLAWLVLGARERYHVIFESETVSFYRSVTDHSLWLTQAECMANFWASKVDEKYYEMESVEVDPPAGNFQSIARCGFSGELLGAPNYHGYQQIVQDFHQARFSNMSLDRYKEKLVMEHDEEVIQQWLDKMKHQNHWRAKQAEGEDAEVSPAPVFHTRREVEQHFLQHGFATEYESGNQMSVLANVPAKMINPGLLTLLIATVAEEKRYPGNLASILCRQMSGRHLAVFKWKKRLHCGPARPRVVPDELAIADRPAALFAWVGKNPGGNIDALWKEILPEGISDEDRHQWYHDLHWLINEGYALLFSDGTLHAAKELGGQQQPNEKKQPKKKKPESPTKEKLSKEEPPTES